jgi:di- and tripeptidase
MDLVESESASEEDQKIWESDSHQVDVALPSSDCGIGHRVLASRSVLALAVDEHCVFAGLQGGDIVVS